MGPNTHPPAESHTQEDPGPHEVTPAALPRREDRPILGGDAVYTTDVTAPGEVHLALLRSRYGHARIEGIDGSAAAAMDGVVGVYTRADLVESGLSGDMPGDEREYAATVDRPILAGERVRFQGDAVAAVVAEDPTLARRAADAIEVEYDRLDAVTDVEEARADGAPTIHEAAPDNVAFEWEAGDPDGTAAAFGAAETVVDLDLSINRAMASPMEPRAVVARYRGSTGELVVDLSCQKVHDERRRFARVLGLPESEIRVRAPSVGGAFGVKTGSYAAHYLAGWCAMRLERPVKWVATRSESFLTTNHSRRHDLTARAALDADGRITGLRVDSTADVGAYLTEGGALIPAEKVGRRLTGAYDVPAAHVTVTGAFTNTTPLSAYRGAGRPEAAYVIERLADACARELGVDPVEFRQRNFVDAGEFPYETALGLTYDSGDYERALGRALDRIDYEAFRERQAAARAEGRYLGIGFSTYVTTCGGGAGSLEGGHVRMTPSGDVVAASSMAENGQGHATGFARVLSETLGVDPGDVTVVEGDTARVPEGGGTGGSKAMSTSGSALFESARAIREQARRVAAHTLEAPPSDLVFEDGVFRIAGAPERSISIQDVAAAAYDGGLPDGLGGLEDTAFFSPAGSTAPFGTHVAVVEVDPDTGEISFERYVAVDDVGTQVNPMLVEGQIVGGVAQAIGQAVYERVAYDDSGSLLSGSLQDYAVPRAFDVPAVEWDSTVTPSPNNPLGVKGVGEAGTIGAMPAVVNAVVDALEPFGVDSLDVPLTDERVYRAIREAEGE